MNCPICGGDTRVINSRLSENVVRRRRLCYSCGNRFTTREISEDEYYQALESKAFMAGLKESIEKAMEKGNGVPGNNI